MAWGLVQVSRALHVPSAGQDAAHLPVVVLADGLRVACILPEQHLHKQQRRYALAHSPLHCRLCRAPLGRCPAAPLCRTFTCYPTLQGLFSCSHVQMRMRDHVTMHRLLNIMHYLWCFPDQTETGAQQQSCIVQEQLPRSAQAKLALILPSSNAWQGSRRACRVCVGCSPGGSGRCSVLVSVGKALEQVAHDAGGKAQDLRCAAARAEAGVGQQLLEHAQHGQLPMHVYVTCLALCSASMGSRRSTPQL